MARVETVGDALEEARRSLEAAGIQEARREAQELYAGLVCGPSGAAWLDRHKPVAEAVRRRLAEAAARRAAGWPQPYAAGRSNFRGHWLAVDQRVLIPRPETEGLVELVIAWANARARQRADALPLVADVGTGSGAIAIALALEAPVSGVVATDISSDSLNLAIENAAALGVKERISFRYGPLLAPLLGERVDAVVSNPPYVATAEWEALDSAVRDYEPRIALDGGPDGLGPTRALVAGAREGLRPGGLLALEADERRAQGAAALARDAGFEAVEVGRDLFGRPRYVTGRQPGNANDR